jgi:hypothetical protein
MAGRRSGHVGDRAAAIVGASILTGAVGLVGFTGGLWSDAANALPLYARQTGLNCDSCHVAFPELTPFGRRFKLNGYTMLGGNSQLPPLAVMLQPTVTHTATPQAGGAAPHFGANDNVELEQASLFTGGHITDNIGAFVQATWDGPANRVSWDNTDVRYANHAELEGHDVLYGVTVNNSPTVQDVWNTAPAWSFPYISPELAPAPAASVLLEGAYAGKVLGAGAYTFVDNMFYGEVSAYRHLSPTYQEALGVAPTGDSPFGGTALYWRFAAEPRWGNNSLEIGTLGFAANIVPQRVNAFGSDQVTDVGVDFQYQYIGDPHEVTLAGYLIGENQILKASQPLGFASNSHDHLQSAKLTASYVYDRAWSVSESYFSVSGKSDATLYGTLNGSPNSSGFTTEIAYLPFMHGGPSFWPWFNARIGLQYIAYTKFDGSTVNVDGTAGLKATGNNTIFGYVWLMF